MEDIKIRSLRDRQKAKASVAPKPSEAAALMPVENPAQAPAPKKKRLLKKISQLAIFCAFVFFIGGLGGVWLDRIFLPNLLIAYPTLNQYDYLKRMNERTTIVRETEEVRITQETAAADAIERVRPSVAEILAKDASGQSAKIGTGIVLTSDGYLITPLKNIYSGQTVNTSLQVKLKDGKTDDAEIVSQNPDYGLAILKINESNLSVIPYADSNSLRLGDKLIFINDAIVTDIISRFIDDYKMPNSTYSGFQKRILIVQNLGATSSGAAVINVEGKLLGVAQSENLIIPISEIKDYIEKGINKQ